MVETDKIAFIFPGQGAQFVGMGKDLYESFVSAREIYDTASRTLNYNIKDLCFEGLLDKLSRTEFSQAAIFTTSIAALSALEESGLKIRPEYVAGLSLGEYSALAASGSIDFEAALGLVDKRGRFMQEASRKNPGRMASILGLDKEEVAEIADESGAQMVNFNCPGQIVISGSQEAIERAEVVAKEKGAKRFMVLKVSGAFHSSFMDEASDKLKQELDKVKFKKPKIKVVFNVTAGEEDEPAKIRENLSCQVNQATFWQKSIEYIASCAVTTFLEIGPGKVLRGLLRRINPDLKVYNIASCAEIEELKKEQEKWF
jgi:[acyl-carrier-protein] S-malonyltransferase